MHAFAFALSLMLASLVLTSMTPAARAAGSVPEVNAAPLLFYYEAEHRFHQELEPRPASGWRGALFGGVSLADEDEIKMATQQGTVLGLQLVIARDVFNRITFLPLELTSQSDDVVSTQNRRVRDAFGRQRRVTYETSVFSGSHRISFLSPDRIELASPGVVSRVRFRRVPVFGLRIELYNDLEEVVASADLARPLPSAYTKDNAEDRIGAYKIAQFPRDVRLQLAAQLRENKVAREDMGGAAFTFRSWAPTTNTLNRSRS